jgi:hypothetical protein
MRYFAACASGATVPTDACVFGTSPATASASHEQPGIWRQPSRARRGAHVRCPTATARKDATFTAAVEATAAAFVIDAYLSGAANLDVERLAWCHGEFARHFCGGATGPSGRSRLARHSPPAH